jgi:hypothetical protein
MQCPTEIRTRLGLRSYILFLQQVFTEHRKLDMIVKQCTACVRYCNAAQNNTILSDLVQHIHAIAGNMSLICRYIVVCR